MGKKLDALLGKSFKTAKFKPLVNLAISRLAVLKNQRQIRCSQARSDVIQLLNLGRHEQALLRVEHVIKEQNMLDVFVMIEGYCMVLIERVNLIEQEKVCPDELQEALSSLLYAASRCGDFPELQEIRAVLTSRYGKDFAARAIELRNNCGVNHRMIQKLSTRMPSLESRLQVLKEIATENDIVLQLDKAASTITEDKLDANQKQKQPEADPTANSGGARLGNGLHILPETKENDEEISGLMKKKKYKDVADAAEAAFKWAADAAEAARAAVELSRSESHDPDDQNSPNARGRIVFDKDELRKSENEITGEEPGEVKNPEGGLRIEKIPPYENYSSETKDRESKQSKTAVELKRSMSSSSSDSEGDILNASMMSLDVLGQTKPLRKEIDFDESDDESMNKESSIPPLKTTHDLGFNMKPSLPTNAGLKTEKSKSITDEDPSEGSRVKRYYPSHKQIPTRFQASTNLDSGLHMPIAHSNERSGIQTVPRLNLEKKPISVRNRRTHVH